MDQYFNSAHPSSSNQWITDTQYIAQFNLPEFQEVRSYTRYVCWHSRIWIEWRVLIGEGWHIVSCQQKCSHIDWPVWITIGVGPVWVFSMISSSLGSFHIHICKCCLHCFSFWSGLIFYAANPDRSIVINFNKGVGTRRSARGFVQVRATSQIACCAATMSRADWLCIFPPEEMQNSIECLSFCN